MRKIYLFLALVACCISTIFAQSITITSPNGSESWDGCTEQQITWTAVGTSDYFSIDYSTDDGVTWTSVTSYYNTVTGSYDWTVPNVSSANCKVKITDSNNSGTFDISDNVFTINAALIVSVPNGGENWEAGTTQEISFAHSGTSNNYNIKYSIDAGSNWTSIVTNYYITSGTYNWQVPNDPSTTCLIEITDYSSSCKSDKSDNLFTIEPPTHVITVTNPNTNVTRYIGNEYNITWTSTYLTSPYVMIELSIDNGSTWSTIVATTNDDGSHPWTVPDSASVDCLIRISEVDNPTTYDISNTNFIIAPPYINITNPNGGENLTGCYDESITWTAGGTSGNYKLEYSTDNGTNWTTITNSSSGTNHNWEVANIPSENCKIRISDINNAATFDENDVVFTIIGNTDIIINNPNGGESWEAGTVETISYALAPTTTRVNISYSTNNGDNWSNITTYYSDISYDWTIPDNPSENSLIRVTDYYNSCIMDESDAAFTIAPPTHVITVTSPNTNITRYIGNSYNITWTSAYLASDFVVIELSIDNGSTWSNVISATNNDGSYSWTVPDIASDQCLIKISEYDNLSTFDLSNETFTIAPPYIEITSPNGTENWTGCDNNSITYNKGGTSGYYRIEYSTDNGTSWSLISSSTSGTNYSWKLPSLFSVECLIKVYDKNDLSIFDISDNNFTINPNPDIIISAPNGGESWEAGTVQPITFAFDVTSDYYNYYYSVDAGENWITIDTYEYTPGGTYNWTVPDNPSENCLIKIIDSYDNCKTDISDAVFTIAPPTHVITVTSPNTNVIRYIGNDYNITWTSAYLTSAYVKIELSVNNGSSWSTIISTTNNNGAYLWTVPDSASTQCLIKISELDKPSVFDVSDENFTIAPPFITVTSPNGGESWTGCDTKTISWTRGGTSNYYKLEYSTDNGNLWNTITSSVSGTSYNWLVANNPSSDCKIRISDANDIEINDETDGVFTIIPNTDIVIATPNGNETWEVGTVQEINFAHAGTSNYYSIYYSIDAGTNWTTIDSYEYITDGIYDWTIPNYPSSNCIVKINDYNNTCISDVSDALFSITPPTHEITVTNPNTAVTRYIGNTYNITWTSAYLTSSFVMIELSVDNGSAWSTIVATTNDDGSYSWDVPDMASEQCLIRISEIGNPSCYDISDENFIITPPFIEVTAPDGGETWEGCESRSITWTRGGTSSYSKIEYSDDNGTNWTTITSSTSGTSYNWTVANLSSGNCKIRISDSNNPLTVNESDNVFTINPNTDIIITSPGNGETWEAGTNQQIEFAWATTSDYYNISYSIDSGQTWITIDSYEHITSGTYNWLVPNTPSDNCFVKVTDYNNTCKFDMNDEVFIISPPTHIINITNPNNSSTRYIGNTYNINWTSAYLTSSYVVIELSTDNGASWATIISSTNNYGSHSWTVPDSVSNECLVKISESGNPSCFDVSDVTFTIAPPYIEIISPNGGEFWKGCDTENISFNHGGTSGYYKIEYSQDNGDSWTTIVSSTSSSSYNWQVANLLSSDCLIRVIDANDVSTIDTSDNVFTINENTDIIVTSPNGSENWEVGTIETITYATAPTSEYYKIYYSTNSGVNWNTISTYTSNTSFDWTIPNEPSNNCLVRVMDYNNTCISDRSDELFTISPPTPVITITSPNSAGITRYVDASNNITWTSAYLSSSFVKIEYSTDSSSTWIEIISATNNDGLYSWLVPNTVSEECLVRISDYGNPETYDVSDNVFTIAPAILLTSPNGDNNGNEKMRGCTETSITWTAGGTSYYYRIEYSINNGDNWDVINSSYYSTATNSSFDWTIPNTPSTVCLVRVSDKNNLTKTDVSDANFEITAPLILEFPNYGGTYVVGTVKNITWKPDGTSNYYNIDYSTDAGSTWNSIEYNYYTLDSSYAWTIPNTPSTTCLVRVVDNVDNCKQDESDNLFTIAETEPPVTIVVPNGNEIWAACTDQEISWNASGTSDYYTVKYSTDGGNSWTTIVSNYYTTDNTYLWTVANFASTICLIEVSDYNNGTKVDRSDAAFTMTAPEAVVSDDVEICIGSGYQLEAGGGESYSWTPITNLTDPNISNPIATPTETINYTVYVTGTYGCTDSASVTVTVDLLPEVPAIPNGSYDLCENSVNTSYTTAGADFAESYTWDLSPANAGTITGTGTEATIDWDNTFLGNTYISVKGVNYCGESDFSDSLLVEIKPLPVVANMPSGTTEICENTENQTYTTTGSNYATSYEWSITPDTAGTITGSDTSAIVNWDDTFTGNAQIFVKGINNCGEGQLSDGLEVIVNPLPLLPATPEGNSVICQGTDSTIFTSDGATHATTYEWYISPLDAGEINWLNDTAIVLWDSAFSGISYISVIGQNNCGEGPESETFTVTINPLPDKPVTPAGTTTLCENSPNTSYTTSDANYADTYNWFILPVEAGVISGNTTSATIDWTDTFYGTAKIVVQGVNNCGEGAVSDTLTITVNPLPLMAAIPVGDTILCENNANSSFATSGADFATSYEWSIVPNEAASISGTISTAIFDWNNSYTGTALLYVTGNNSCGSGIVSEPLSVELNNLPDTAAIPSGLTTLCINSSNTTYTTSGADFATSFEWLISPAGAGIASGSTDTTTVDWDELYSGNIFISVKGINDCGEGAFSEALSVYINPLPSVPEIPEGDTNLCINNVNSSYTTVITDNATEYIWELLPVEAGTITGTGLTSTVDWEPDFSGSAYISVQGSNSCGVSIASESLEVEINDIPAISGTPSGTTIICQNSENTTYTTLGATNAISYDWTISPGDAGSITNNDLTCTVNWNESFYGTAFITVKGLNNCGEGEMSDALSVTINPLPFQATIPSGDTTLCENNSNTSYSTTGATYATGYNWEISPIEAGSVSGTGTSAIVDWNETFNGTALIYVTGTNSCGEGIVSSALEVELEPIPDIPEKPSGLTSLCINSQNTSYFTSNIPNAVSYNWTLNPGDAGSIEGTTTTATVDWSEDYFGNAEILVKAINDCGESDFSETLIITINNIPGQPVTPAGLQELCENNANTSYSTDEVVDATGYTWLIIPSEAGSVSGAGTNAIVDWNDSFAGTVLISVKAYNSCGDGVASNALIVNIDELPEIPSTPMGVSTLCIDSENTTYSTSGATNATDYAWNLTPVEAGIITQDSDTVIINWGSGFTGSVSLTVNGINDCGNGPASDALTITVNPLPGAANIPEGNTDLCINNSNTSYTVASILNATNYIWNIAPDEVGIITGTSTSAVVDWADEFSGSAFITVKGINSCGEGQESEALTITVAELPEIAGTPSGLTSLCEDNENTSYATSGAVNAFYYIWNLEPGNAGNISGNTTTAEVDWNETYNGSAQITVKGVSYCGEGISSSALDVTVSPIPGISGIPDGENEICQNGPNSAFTTSGASNASEYQWYLSPADAGTISGSSITSTVDWDSDFSGTTYVSVQAINDCGAGEESQAFAVTINPLPDMAAVPTGDYEICKGEHQLQYTTTGANHANDYSWGLSPEEAGMIQGNGLTAAVDFYDTYTGSATIFVVGLNECGEGEVSNSLLVNVYELPEIPVITQNGNQLVSSTATSYQWYSESGIISGATFQSYSPGESGTFWMVVGNEFECEAQSDAFDFIYNMINEISEEQIKVYPNPSDGNFTLEFDNISIDINSVYIVDALGLTVYRNENIDVKYQKINKININVLQAGIYTIVIEAKDQRIIKRLMIMD